MFLSVIALLIWQMANPKGFSLIWSWFGWSNQTLSVFTLWAITVYLVRQQKNYWVTLIPALFMTTVCTTFLFSVQAFKLDGTASAIVAVCALAISAVWFSVWKKTKSNHF